MSNQKNERRKYPRLKKNLPLEISKEDFNIVTEVENISCSGVYCQIDRFFPLMSKVEIVLLIPVQSRNKTITKKINCGGVIVRSEPVILKDTDSAHNNVAIFFAEIKESDRNIIAQYINCNLSKSEDKNSNEEKAIKPLLAF